jgi:hypothetical protein
MPTLSDLLTYCRQQARIEARDYLDPYSHGELRSQQISAWRRDCRLRDQARKACFRAFPARLNKGTEALISGNYGRLSIAADGSPRGVSPPKCGLFSALKLIFLPTMRNASQHCANDSAVAQRGVCATNSF